MYSSLYLNYVLCVWHINFTAFIWITYDFSPIRYSKLINICVLVENILVGNGGRPLFPVIYGQPLSHRWLFLENGWPFWLKVSIGWFYARLWQVSGERRLDEHALVLLPQWLRVWSVWLVICSFQRRNLIERFDLRFFVSLGELWLFGQAGLWDVHWRPRSYQALFTVRDFGWWRPWYECSKNQFEKSSLSYFRFELNWSVCKLPFPVSCSKLYHLRL